MEHYLLTDTLKIKENKWGIPEPVSGIKIPEKDLEVIFVPLLVFDQKGHRIGYGKGFYDRFLAKCPENSIKIGVSFLKQSSESIEVLPTDVPLDYCITPDKVYKFH